MAKGKASPKAILNSPHQAGLSGDQGWGSYLSLKAWGKSVKDFFKPKYRRR